MKRSDFVNKFQEDWGVNPAEDAAKAAEAAGVTWDPEEPEGFGAFYKSWLDAQNGMFCTRDLALATWNACLSHQGAQQRAIEPKVDPEVRRKEIEAHIKSWAEERWLSRPDSLISAGRNLLRRLGVL